MQKNHSIIRMFVGQVDAPRFFLVPPNTVPVVSCVFLISLWVVKFHALICAYIITKWL